MEGTTNNPWRDYAEHTLTQEALGKPPTLCGFPVKYTKPLKNVMKISFDLDGNPVETLEFQYE